MEKEEFIHQILNSTNGIAQVSLNDALFAKIEQRIQEKKLVPLQTLFLVAASIVILISINLSLLTKTTSETKEEVTTTSASSLNKNNQLY
jgi:hypothetical protein